MEKLEVSSLHEHPLVPFTRFVYGFCKGCSFEGYIYGGYRCNELGCAVAVFHKECGEALPEINHSSHPDHPLKFYSHEMYSCSCCGKMGPLFGYSCLVCDFKLDLVCARRGSIPPILAKPSVHEHPLELCHDRKFGEDCKACKFLGCSSLFKYGCVKCKLYFHVECVSFFPEAYHTSHPKHPLKFLTREVVPTYAYKECILCRKDFYLGLNHCDVCNFSVCRSCMKNPPPVVVECLKTHEHQLHLVPRLIDFTCNACGTTGDRSPYFCLLCNYMIHRECMDLPRIININRHDHRISYTSHLGHGEWKCKVCRKKVDGFYGAYSCSKCPSFVVHARCATRKDVWDMVEREGTPEEEEEIGPYEVIDDNTIRHFSHDHNLRINKDGEIIHESVLCGACTFQICSEPFYNCENCNFTLHTKCANLPRKKRHVCSNLPLILQTSTYNGISQCHLCGRYFTGFEYANRSTCTDLRCGLVSEPFVHGSHPHPLYISDSPSNKVCRGCEGCKPWRLSLICDECDDYSLCFKCGFLPGKVMRHRYDDHPLSLSYGETSVDGEYWCEACETKLNPKEWFYTCNDCGVVLHISCIVGDFTYMRGPFILNDGHQEVVPNTSVCRTFCTICSMRCILPSILKSSKDEVVKYFCSFQCYYVHRRIDYDP